MERMPPVIAGTAYYRRGDYRKNILRFTATFSLSRGYKLVRPHYPAGPYSYQAVIPLIILLITTRR